MKWNLIVYELPDGWGDIIPVMLSATFDDFVQCMVWNNNFTEVLTQTLPFGSYFLMCVGVPI